MGIYDRQYYQDEEQQRRDWLGGRSLVVNLIILNVGVWIVDMVSDNRITEYFSLKPDLFRHPWQAWQLVTYGFVHDTRGVMHILFNMFGLWFFGSEIENAYGKGEFLRFYLTAIIVAGLAWVGVETLQGAANPLIGASGGIMALMILYVVNFPRRTLLIWGVLPLPAWALGLLYVLIDLGSVGSNDNVAHWAHLSGVAYGLVYWRTGLVLGKLPRGMSLPRWRPKLKMYNPESETVDLNEQVDRILEKISRTGESSLTKKERETLEKASRRYQRRRE